MVFSSVLFLSVFLPSFLACFYISPQFLKKWIIVFFSILFYAWGAPLFIFFLLGSSIIDFFISKNFEAQNRYRKISLFTSLLLNIGLLCYFKYVNFFVTNFIKSNGLTICSKTSNIKTKLYSLFFSILRLLLSTFSLLFCAICNC